MVLKGLDEISSCGPTKVCEVKNGVLKTYEITPEAFGLKQYSNEELLVGGASQENAEIIRTIFRGEKGAKRDAAVLNAAAALYIAGKYASIKKAVEVVENIIDSGAAMKKLNEFIICSNEA